MSGKGFRLRWQPTTVGGTITESMTSWPQIVNGSVTLNYIYVKCPQEQATFDFLIVSPTGNIIWSRRNNVGDLSETMNLIMKGLYSLTIENVKLNGVVHNDTFDCEFMCEERKNK